MLLARGANFPRPWFSTLAGFVEPGESFEETVAREVKEEVGVDVKNLRYFGCQPWPFGRSVMVGFNAECAGGEIAPTGRRSPRRTGTAATSCRTCRRSCRSHGT